MFRDGLGVTPRAVHHLDVVLPTVLEVDVIRPNGIADDAFSTIPSNWIPPKKVNGLVSFSHLNHSQLMGKMMRVYGDFRWLGMFSLTSTEPGPNLPRSICKSYKR